MVYVFQLNRPLNKFTQFSPKLGSYFGQNSSSQEFSIKLTDKMKFAIAASLFAAFANAKAPAHYELTSEYSFAQYKADHNKNYAPSEHVVREKIFEVNKSKIIAHNKLLGTTYKMGINEFTDMEEDEGNL